MFTFIPQLLIVLSLAGIILIVVRRTPELKIPMPVHLKNAENLAVRWVKTGAQKLWHFVLEVKELSKKTEATIASHIPRHLPKIHFPSFPRPLQKKSASAPPASPSFVEQAAGAVAAGQHLAAEDYFIKAIKQDPKSEPAFAGLGKLYLIQNKAKEALEIFEYLVKHHPGRSEYVLGLSEALIKKGERQEAEQILQQLLTVEPTNTLAREKLMSIKY